jgi:hypothetical protein
MPSTRGEAAQGNRAGAAAIKSISMMHFVVDTTYHSDTKGHQQRSRQMNTYTAFNSQDSSEYESGLSLQEALDMRWDIDGSKKASEWVVMSDDDFAKHQSGNEYMSRINPNGVTVIAA